MTTPTNTTPDDPIRVYARHLADRKAAAEGWEQRHLLFGNLKLAAVAGMLLTAFLVFGSPKISGRWLAVSVVLFILLTRRHDAIHLSREIAGRAVRHYERGIRRLRGEWQDEGSTGKRFLNQDHLYAPGP